MFIGTSLLVLSLLGGLKRFAINLLNGFYGDWPPRIGAFLFIKIFKKEKPHISVRSYIFWI